MSLRWRNTPGRQFAAAVESGEAGNTARFATLLDDLRERFQRWHAGETDEAGTSVYQMWLQKLDELERSYFGQAPWPEL